MKHVLLNVVTESNHIGVRTEPILCPVITKTLWETCHVRRVNVGLTVRKEIHRCHPSARDTLLEKILHCI
jgi:hypothetical protein